MIGASLSLPGDFSADGQAFQKGYSLWVSEVNSQGGILGRQVKLDVLNDNSSPTQVVTNYQNLINKDHVDLTFGPFSTLLTIPASRVAKRYGYAFLDPAVRLVREEPCEPPPPLLSTATPAPAQAPAQGNVLAGSKLWH